MPIRWPYRLITWTDARHLDFPQDWVHVDNLVDAIGCAARALRSKPGAVGGRPYFINDGEPVITRWSRFHDPFRD